MEKPLTWFSLLRLYLNNFDYGEALKIFMYFWKYVNDWRDITDKVRKKSLVSATTYYDKKLLVEKSVSEVLGDRFVDTLPNITEQIEVIVRDIREASSKRAWHYPLGEDEKLRGKVLKEFDIYLSELENNLNLYIERLMDEGSDNFFEMVKKFFINSKIESQDILIVASALSTRSHIFLTKDMPLTDEGKRVAVLKEFLEKLPLPKDEGRTLLDFVSPAIVGTSPKKCVRSLFKQWFSNAVKDKILGKVVKTYVKRNVVVVECTDDYVVSEGDTLCLFKFNGSNNFLTSFFKIEEGKLWDNEKDHAVKEGKKVTIELPTSTKCKSWMTNSKILEIA
jgi:hypothetical protein